MVREFVLKKPLVSVLILTWNRCSYVLRAIESVYNQSYHPIEIIIVDSASSDGTVEVINNRFPDIKIIKLHRNLGCPEGRNIGLANCNGEIIFSLDDDAYLEHTTIERCVEKFSIELNLGVIACNIIDKEKIVISKNLRTYYSYLFCGGAFALRKDIISKVGYFPSDFYRQAEEGDLALRIIEAGYSIIFYPEAIVYHKQRNINQKNKKYFYYGCRNEIYTIVRQYPLFLVPIALLWKIFIWNWTGIKYFSLHYTLLGSLIGIIKIPELLLQRKPVSFSTIKKLIILRNQKVD